MNAITDGLNFLAEKAEDLAISGIVHAAGLQDQDGAFNFINTIVDKGIGRQGGPELSWEEQFAQIQGQVTQLQQLEQQDPQIFAKLNTILATPGAPEFLNSIASNEKLKEVFGGGLDLGGDPAANAALIDKLNTMATQDPELFNKLNTIIGAEGFDGFLDRVKNNPALADVFNDMLTGTDLSSGNSSALIDGLYDQLQKNPELFNVINQTMDDHPDMINTIATELRDDPAGAMGKLDMLMNSKDFLTQISDFFKNFSLEGGLEGLLQILLAVVTGINGMTESLAGGALNLLGGTYTQGNGATPDPAAAPAPAHRAVEDASMAAYNKTLTPDGPG